MTKAKTFVDLERKRATFLKNKERHKTKILQREKIKSNRGITLIALVVTIVILLILAGITINAIMGEGGLIDRAKIAENKTMQGAENDINAINNLENQLEGIINGIGNEEGTVNPPTPQEDPLGQYKQASMLTRTTHTKITIEDYEVTIPAGYVLAPDTGNTVEEGIVITDSLEATGETTVSNGNEWVWVPVSNEELEQLFVEEEVELIYGITTSYYTNTESYTSEYHIEPYVLSHSICDGNAENREKAGFNTSLEEMAEQMVEEYDEMLSCIDRDEGFYIGRYELGMALYSDMTETVVKRDRNVKTYVDWYELYSDCKGLAKNQNCATRMIWGLQWNATCNWLDSMGVDMQNPDSWGNYTGEPQKTGNSNDWVACNIYDFAGNFLEWTQESYGDENRVFRGGCDYETADPVVTYGREWPTSNGVGLGCRPVLLIK